MPRSRRRKESQVISAAVEAMDLYSASALDRATVAYFFALHDMQLLPRKVQKPVVDLRVVGHPAQSALENP